MTTPDPSRTSLDLWAIPRATPRNSRLGEGPSSNGSLACNLARVNRSEPHWLESIRMDASKLWSGRRGFLEKCFLLLVDPGFEAVILYRAQQALQRRGLLAGAYVLSSINHKITGAQFMPGADLGPGLVLKHPSGVVVGAGVVAGRNLTLLQGVTVGQSRVDERADDRYPRLGNGVTVGAYAVIVGDIVVGDGAKIGAQAFLNRDLAPGDVVTRVDRRNTDSTTEGREGG